jgi:hypothetical protein
MALRGVWGGELQRGEFQCLPLNYLELQLNRVDHHRNPHLPAYGARCLERARARSVAKFDNMPDEILKSWKDAYDA